MGKSLKCYVAVLFYFNKGEYIISVFILLIAMIETARANGFSVSQKLHERLIQFLTPEILRRN